MLDILGKIQIIMGKGTAYIIIGLMTAFCQLLELRYNQIIAALSLPLNGRILSLYLLSDRRYSKRHCHLFIQKFHEFHHLKARRWSSG